MFCLGRITEQRHTQLLMVTAKREGNGYEVRKVCDHWNSFFVSVKQTSGSVPPPVFFDKFGNVKLGTVRTLKVITHHVMKANSLENCYLTS